MAFDEGLAERVRESLGERPDFEKMGLEEKHLFGGAGFMLNGNMACGVIDDLLIVRVGPDTYADALAKPHANEFDFTGRPMKGWVQILPAGTDDDGALAEWIGAGVRFASSLPPK